MIVGTGKLIEWFSINNKPFWIIRRSEKSEMITRSPEDDIDLDTVKSKDLLQQALSLLSPEVYYIQTWGGIDPKSTTGAKTCVHFRLLDNESRLSNQPAIIAGIDPLTFESKLEAELNKRMDAYEKERKLTDRITELERRLTEGDTDSRFIGRIIDRVEPWAMKIFPEYAPTANVGTLQPIKKEDIKEMTSDQVEKIEAALAVLQSKVGEESLPILMEKLAALSQNDPKTFKMALQILG